MCPSYLATREEKDSTRGRARVLQEALDGALIDGLADPAVHEALDLCLSCKGCARDCPTGVDMATYKSEVLHQNYRRQAAAAVALHAGPAAAWARLTAPMRAGWPTPMLRLRGRPPRLAKSAAGVDQRRGLPAFAPDARCGAARRASTPAAGHARRVAVGRLVHRPLLARLGHAAIGLLEAAG